MTAAPCFLFRLGVHTLTLKQFSECVGFWPEDPLRIKNWVFEGVSDSGQESPNVVATRVVLREGGGWGASHLFATAYGMPKNCRTPSTTSVPVTGPCCVCTVVPSFCAWVKVVKAIAIMVIRNCMGGMAQEQLQPWSLCQSGFYPARVDDRCDLEEELSIILSQVYAERLNVGDRKLLYYGDQGDICISRIVPGLSTWAGGMEPIYLACWACFPLP